MLECWLRWWANREGGPELEGCECGCGCNCDDDCCDCAALLSVLKYPVSPIVFGRLRRGLLFSPVVLYYMLTTREDNVS